MVISGWFWAFKEMIKRLSGVFFSIFFVPYGFLSRRADFIGHRGKNTASQGTPSTIMRLWSFRASFAILMTNAHGYGVCSVRAILAQLPFLKSCLIFTCNVAHVVRETAFLVEYPVGWTRGSCMIARRIFIRRTAFSRRELQSRHQAPSSLNRRPRLL